MSGRQQRYGIFIDIVTLQHLMDECNGSTVGVVSIASTLENAGIATLETKGKDIKRHIGPRLIDDANHSERHSHAMKSQPIGERSLMTVMPQRRRQFRHVAHISRNTFQSLWRQLESVVERILHIHALQVLSISLQQRILLRHDSLRHIQ